MSDTAVLARQRVEPSVAQGSILIIDDEMSIRESLETLFAMEGYNVETADHGEEGLAKLASAPVDLVLLDFALPGKNGLEVLEEIRERDPNLPVIMRSEEHTSELQSPCNLVCRLLLEKKKRQREFLISLLYLRASHSS